MLARQLTGEKAPDKPSSQSGSVASMLQAGLSAAAVLALYLLIVHWKTIMAWMRPLLHV